MTTHELKLWLQARLEALPALLTLSVEHPEDAQGRAAQHTGSCLNSAALASAPPSRSLQRRGADVRGVLERSELEEMARAQMRGQ